MKNIVPTFCRLFQIIWNIWFPLDKKNYASKSLVHSPKTTHLEKISTGDVAWGYLLHLQMAEAQNGLEAFHQTHSQLEGWDTMRQVEMGLPGMDGQ